MKRPIGPILSDDADEGRRRVLAWLGGGIAAASLSACTRRPPEPILPHSEEVPLVPGRPVRYATTALHRGLPIGLLVESWEGHPTKVEGNPRHPASGGATTVWEQAIPASLYDPGRASQIAERGAPRTWRAFHAAQIRRARALGRGAGLRFLLEPEPSPLLADLRGRLRERFPEARFIAWHGTVSETPLEAARIAFGEPRVLRLEPGRARVVVALDADFLCTEGDGVRHARELMQARKPGPEMSRLHAAESRMSLTGSAADHRVAVRPSEMPAIAQGLLRRIAAARPDSPLRAFVRSARAVESAAVARWLDGAAADLLRSPGRGLVVAGERQPMTVQLAALAIDEALGNLGTTSTAAPPPWGNDLEWGIGALATLAGEMADGAVDTLVVSAWNPAYAAPADLELRARLAAVPHAVYLGAHADETWRTCAWTLPAAHALESWGDARSTDGIVSLVQPLIAPLFGGLQLASVLGTLLEEPDLSPYERLRAFWRARYRGRDFESDWMRWLADGVLPDRDGGPARPQFRWDAAATAHRAGEATPEVAPVAGRERADGTELEAEIVPDFSILDGRHARNAWLRELPDPITKVTWENAALLSPATATALGLTNGEVVRLAHAGREIEAPVWTVPGQADGSIVLPLGYGRDDGMDSDARGFDANRLRTAAAPWLLRGVTIAKTARRHRFAVTQDHASQEGRPIARQVTLADLLSKGAHLTEEQRGDLPTFHDLRTRIDEGHAGSTPPRGASPYRWAMAVDLHACIGCNACVIACQSENNVPVVGKAEVAKGREMHWLRIDRYVDGPPDDPQLVHQPMACVHCETAPCEYVCPVNATVHSDEGLNEMVYNRCVGTRYCSNNCPYKVRRFNYYAYAAPASETERMALNPDVTVRARGVMEKCTYCVQRIERARIESRIEGREIRRDEVTTACAQACPTRAIVFGSLHDEGAEVTQRHRDPRRYDVLHELGTKPRTAYLLKVRNPGENG